MRIWGSTVSVLFVDASGVGLLKWAAKTEPETNGAAKTDPPQVSKANLIAFMACFGVTRPGCLVAYMPLANSPSGAIAVAHCFYRFDTRKSSHFNRGQRTATHAALHWVPAHLEPLTAIAFCTAARTTTRRKKRQRTRKALDHNLSEVSRAHHHEPHHRLLRRRQEVQ